MHEMPIAKRFPIVVAASGLLAASVIGIVLLVGDREKSPQQGSGGHVPRTPHHDAPTTRSSGIRPTPLESKSVVQEGNTAYSDLVGERSVSDVQVVLRLSRLYDGDPVDLAWANRGDMPVLQSLHDLWRPRIMEARKALGLEAGRVHEKRYYGRQCKEYPADQYTVKELQQKEHPLQVVCVGTYTYPGTQVKVHRVSRFEPGDDPAIDTAQLALTTRYAELRAAIEEIRAGR